ncbi:MAG: hypothetical protein JRI22_23830 [Deltaproteobacteria bacterium]|nr:hypothetical protein [Deltaproteobacteria bacterium]
MIYCALCGYKAHQILIHLEKKHKMSVAGYRERFPQSPVISRELAEKIPEINHADPLEKESRTKKIFKINGFEIEGFAEPGRFTPIEDPYYHFLPELEHLIVAAAARARWCSSLPRGSTRMY